MNEHNAHRSAGNPGDDRDQTADDRDRRADAHDEASAMRDANADARDNRAEARETAAGGGNAEVIADRAGALRDRRGGASDRTQAADDRHASHSDRTLSAQERAVSSLDGLTRAHRREAGLVELDREVDRAKRTGQPFTLAFLDVVGLKAVNDALGHAAGDELLLAVADSIRDHLRSYDLVIRYGGDEFVCALPDMDTDQAADRFAKMNVELAAQHAHVSVGLAERRADDSLDDLIARADEAMYEARERLSKP